MPELKLDADAVALTIDLLCRRIEERFPDSGLSRVGRELARIAKRTRERAAAIARPIQTVRVAVILLIVLIASLLAGTLAVGSLARRPPASVSLLPDQWQR